MKAKALKGTETKISESEYDEIFFVLCRDKNDAFFKDSPENFKAVPIRRWPTMLEDLKLNVHFQDVHSVEHYIKQFNAKNQEKVDEHDLRKAN